ncbi:helix-turn-helix domain-containing protein [Capsulimonas corticalis]|uniref:helix-turn-helix domain-containing protein n=1 Tax=Capsulimonas corticalis TaxID=2219043 RepID=UPI00140371BD|nr:helix-turn-helix domain-containing protein [Capsulimonas corticalis]
MKFVSPLSEADQTDLTAVYRNGPSHRQHQRAQAVLLSAQGYTLDQLSQIVQTDPATISRWLDQWQEYRISFA